MKGRYPRTLARRSRLGNSDRAGQTARDVMRQFPRGAPPGTDAHFGPGANAPSEHDRRLLYTQQRMWPRSRALVRSVPCANLERVALSRNVVAAIGMGTCQRRRLDQRRVAERRLCPVPALGSRHLLGSDLDRLASSAKAISTKRLLFSSNLTRSRTGPYVGRCLQTSPRGSSNVCSAFKNNGRSPRRFIRYVPIPHSCTKAIAILSAG